MDLSDTIHTATTEREVKKRWKNQLLARSLHSCPRSQVRKWVDEDDQKSFDYGHLNDMVDIFLERGFTYFNTTLTYHEGKSE